MEDKGKYPKITVITPSYNQGQFIEETILSIISQNYPNLEYIIVDGGSTDMTLDVVGRYKEFVDILISEKDSGQANAINKGFNLATGEIICWLNSDDMFTSNALLAVAKVYDSVGFEFLFGDGVKQYEYGFRKGSSRSIKIDTLKLNELTYRDPFQQPSTFWTRSALNKVGLLDESLHYAFDWDFFIKMDMQANLHYLPMALSIYRIHALHKSGDGGFERAKEIVEVATRYADANHLSLYNLVLAEHKKIFKLKKFFKRYTYIAFYLLSPKLYLKIKVSDLKFPVRMISS